jgi:hypothetical protein
LKSSLIIPAEGDAFLTSAINLIPLPFFSALLEFIALRAFLHLSFIDSIETNLLFSATSMSLCE